MKGLNTPFVRVRLMITTAIMALWGTITFFVLPVGASLASCQDENYCPACKTFWKVTRNNPNGRRLDIRDVTGMSSGAHLIERANCVIPKYSKRQQKQCVNVAYFQGTPQGYAPKLHRDDPPQTWDRPLVGYEVEMTECESLTNTGDYCGSDAAPRAKASSRGGSRSKASSRSKWPSQRVDL